MTKEEIKYGNRLIAEFLGGTVRCYYKRGDYEDFAWQGEIAHKWRKEKMKIPIGEAILEDSMVFHSNWDWLMPVVEEILNFDNQADAETIELDGYDDLQILHTSIFCYKEEVYKRVVKFIEWYNKNIRTDQRVLK